MGLRRSRPGTLNDFLTALDEGDLKPDVVKRFEEMLAQAQQSAEAAAESERQSGQHAADAQKIKDDCQMLADNVQQNAEAVAEDKQRVEHLASEVELNAGQVQQSITDAVKQAQQVADDAASSAEESKNNAQEAKQYRDEAQQIIDGLNATNATTMDKGLVQLCSDTDNDTEELAATPKAVKAVMDEVKGKAPLDSPAFTGMPTTPTPSQDASGCEIVNAEFVRALIAATSSGSYSTDSVVPLVINGAQPIIDGLFLGKFAGLNAMASVNIVGPFMQVIFAVSFIVCTGAISLIGRSLGESREDKACSVFRTAVIFITVISILVAIFGSVFSKGIAKCLKRQIF